MTRRPRREFENIEHRPPKRQKLTDTTIPKYSTRYIPWEEQKELGERFASLGEGTWPATIVDERKIGRVKEYLLDWESHPKTGEIFQPSWEPATNVGDYLIEVWRKKEKHNSICERSTSVFTPSDNAVYGTSTSPHFPRKRKARQVIPDSSSDIGSGGGDPSPSKTPTLASSPASSVAESDRPQSPGVEILETQPSPEIRPISITIPSVDIDKDDFLSLHSSDLAFPSSSLQSLVSSLVTSPSTKVSRSIPSTSRSTYRSLRSVISRNPSSRLSVAHKKLVEAINNSTSSDKRVALSPLPIEESLTSPAVQISDDNSSPILVEASPASTSSSSALFFPDSSSGYFTRSSVSKRKGAQSCQSSPLAHSRSPSNSQSLGRIYHSCTPAEELRPKDYQNSPLQAQSERTESQSPKVSSPWVFQSQTFPRASNSNLQRSRATPSSYSVTLKKRLFKTLDHPLEIGCPNSSEDLHPDTSRIPNTQFSSITDSAARQHSERQQTMPASSARSPIVATGERMRRTRSNQGNQSSPPTSNEIARSNNAKLLQNYTVDPSSEEYFATIGQNLVLEPSKGGQSRSQITSEIVPQQITQNLVPSLNTSPIQQSIEEEQLSSAEEPESAISKSSSSPLSAENEPIIPQFDGILLPVHLVLGPSEHPMPLPAEGKVQSTYLDTIKAKRKTILKFIHRQDSVGSANGSTSRTVERNEMNELIDRLHNTVTHLDLGLPGFYTQYSWPSKENDIYADYAGSKFTFLGNFLDRLANVDCSIVIAAQSGTIQDLLEEFLTMRDVFVRRHDRTSSSSRRKPHQRLVQVDLISTNPSSEITLPEEPRLIIAFDASFNSQEPQVTRIRELHSRGRDQLLPVLHFLVMNSSEHIDRCLRKSMPSPQRLKLLVRATYQARNHLGGPGGYEPRTADLIALGHSPTFADYQKLERKAPWQKLQYMSNELARAVMSTDFEDHWSPHVMPDVIYDDLEESPPKGSRPSTAANTAAPTPRDGRARSRSPFRTSTPSGKRRFLEVDTISPALAKRQRLTPLRDMVSSGSVGQESNTEAEQSRQTLKSLQTELAFEKELRRKEEEARETAEKRLGELTGSLADLQRRYEKRMMKCHNLEKANKALTATIEGGKARQEKTAKENIALKAQIGQLQTDLVNARSDLKAAGGDIAALEFAREEARTAKAKTQSLEKSIESTKKDFEFTRQQYQQASNRAAELASQNNELESEVTKLRTLASDEKRRLKEMNFDESLKQHLHKIEELELERKGHLALMKKMEDEVRGMRKNRGVQTRGSSVQPSSPGPRSRQGSPVPGMLLPSSAHAGTRASVLRNER